MGKIHAQRRRPVPSKRQSAFEQLEGRELFTATPVAAPAGSAKLAGAVIGTAGSYQNKGNTTANAFDGKASTYADAATGSGNWAGLDLGTPQQVTQVQFLPRGGYAGRMVGGTFQGSTTADFSAGVVNLFTVTTAPGTSAYTAVPVTAGGPFEYVRYVSPAGSYDNVAEIEFDGTAPVTAVPNTPATPVATATAAGVHLAWAGDPTSVVNTYAVQRQGPTDADVRDGRRHGRDHVRRPDGGRLDGVRVPSRRHE